MHLTPSSRNEASRLAERRHVSRHVTLGNLQTRLAVLHHHGDDLVEMEETYRDRDVVAFDETAIAIYRCPRCDTIVTVGSITTEVGVASRPDAPGAI